MVLPLGWRIRNSANTVGQHRLWMQADTGQGLVSARGMRSPDSFCANSQSGAGEPTLQLHAVCWSRRSSSPCCACISVVHDWGHVRFRCYRGVVHVSQMHGILAAATIKTYMKKVLKCTLRGLPILGNDKTALALSVTEKHEPSAVRMKHATGLADRIRMVFETNPERYAQRTSAVLENAVSIDCSVAPLAQPCCIALPTLHRRRDIQRARFHARQAVST